jgi:hypothetical protein
MQISSAMGRIAAVLLVLVPVTAAPQNAEPPNPLTSVKGLKCRFPAATSAAWKNGEVVAQTKTQELLFTISEIDVQDGTAEFVGTAGRAFVTAVLSGWSIYFVESSVGQLNVTTVAGKTQSRALTPRLSADAGRQVHRRAVRVTELRRLRDAEVKP